MIKSFSLACAVVLLLAGPACAETLAEASAFTMSHHPTIAADNAAIDAASESLTRARSDYFPAVSASSELNTDNYTRDLGPVGLFGRQAGLTASQVIFDGMATPGRVNSADATRTASRADHDVDANSLLLSVSKAYIDVLQARAQLTAAQHNLEEHQTSVKRLTAMVAADYGKGFDLVQIKARTVLAASIVTERKAALATAEDAYRELVGRAAGELEPPPLLTGTEFTSLDAALAAGSEQHPTVLAAVARRMGKEGDRGATTGALSPRVDAVGRYVKGADIQSLPGQNDEAYAGLRASYDFPLGLGTVAASRAANAAVAQAASQVDVARRDVRKGVCAAWQQRQGLIETLPLATEHWHQLGKELEGFRAQYTLGHRTMLDLLLVQSETYTAETRKIQLAYDRLEADYALAAQAGTLLKHTAPAVTAMH